MCGGRGTRLDAAVEKPLFEVAGRPMVDRVVDALAESRVERIRAAVSPHAPATAAHLARRFVDVVETPGEGYVEDLGTALGAVDLPVLTVAADLPLLERDAVDRVLGFADGDASVTVCVPAALKRRLGASVERTRVREGVPLAPTGLNVVASPDTERTFPTYDARLAVNVNRPGDAAVAEALAEAVDGETPDETIDPEGDR
ncbi:MAG: NTP transferase domain-containing protein [Salinigranum sp.]